jgi:hypothetical protein
MYIMSSEIQSNTEAPLKIENHKDFFKRKS